MELAEKDTEIYILKKIIYSASKQEPCGIHINKEELNCEDCSLGYTYCLNKEKDEDFILNKRNCDKLKKKAIKRLKKLNYDFSEEKIDFI